MGLGDVKQYLINLEGISVYEDILGSGQISEKAYFYIFILYISYLTGIAAVDIFSIIGIGSYACVLLASNKISSNRISISVQLTNLVLVTSPFYIYFFMSNVRSGLSFAICFLALCYFKSRLIKFFLAVSAVIVHKIALVLIFYYLVYYFVSLGFGKLKFLTWFIIIGIGTMLLVISLINGYLPLKVNFEPWGAGSAYSIGYMTALLLLTRFFWSDNPLWFSALSTNILAFCLFIADVHAVRILSLAGVLCACGVFLNNRISVLGKYILISLLYGLSSYHYYLIVSA